MIDSAQRFVSIERLRLTGFQIVEPLPDFGFPGRSNLGIGQSVELLVV